MLNWFKKKSALKKENSLLQIGTMKNANIIPEHIAIIMDGNGRWAKKRYLPRIAGHKEGMENVRTITLLAQELGVKVLTLYAFSTENWNRSKEEVAYLMDLPALFLNKFLLELVEKKIRVIVTGIRDNVPKKTLFTIDKAVLATEKNTEFILNFAFNYGSQMEIVNAVNNIISDARRDKIVTPITRETFASYLFTANLPDPDLLIRTSGELRVSNFMLWQLAYTEFYFTEVLWPDFKEGEFLKALESFTTRRRRYGGRQNESEEK